MIHFRRTANTRPLAGSFSFFHFTYLSRPSASRCKRPSPMNNSLHIRALEAARRSQRSPQDVQAIFDWVFEIFQPFFPVAIVARTKSFLCFASVLTRLLLPFVDHSPPSFPLATNIGANKKLGDPLVATRSDTAPALRSNAVSLVSTAHGHLRARRAW